MKRTRHQSGYVFRKGKNWYLRYREDVLLDGGSHARSQKCVRLAAATGRYRSKAAAQVLADEILRPVNDGSQTIESTMTLNNFIESAYLPFAEQHRKSSTFHGYRNLWKRYIRPDGEVMLRDFKTSNGGNLLTAISRREDLSRSSLANIKHFLGAVFTYSRRQGVLNTPNPMRDVELPKARPAAETYAYSLEEELRMLLILPEPASTVVAAAMFTGARKGELRAFAWENYDGSNLWITQSAWRGEVEEPKTPASKDVIPVIAPLREKLERFREFAHHPSAGFIFANAEGKPVNLDALAMKVIRPGLKAAGLEWHGWHAFRRGLATNLNRLGVAPKVIQQILRHARVSTTYIYIKGVSEDAVDAMGKLEEQIGTKTYHVATAEAAAAGAVCAEPHVIN
jgi:integrase